MFPSRHLVNNEHISCFKEKLLCIVPFCCCCIMSDWNYHFFCNVKTVVMSRFGVHTGNSLVTIAWIGAAGWLWRQTGNESLTVRRLNSCPIGMSCRCPDWECSTGEMERGEQWWQEQSAKELQAQLIRRIGAGNMLGGIMVANVMRHYFFLRP